MKKLNSKNNVNGSSDVDMKKDNILEGNANEDIDFIGKVLKVLKKIFIIITSPVWFFWKVLFIRKPDKKFSVVDNKTRLFRVVTNFLLIPLKFCIFLLIIVLEVVLVYKVRYSFITYPMTRGSVHGYYLKKIENSTKFEEAFNTIDDWNLSERNKMYVILDSDISKKFFNHANEKIVNHVLDRFNSDEKFREDIKYNTKNINKTISRFVREYKDVLENPQLESIVGPIANVSSYAVDYTVVLDVLDKISDLLISTDELESDNFDTDDIDVFFDAITDFSKGKSVNEIIRSREN